LLGIAAHTGHRPLVRWNVGEDNVVGGSTREDPSADLAEGISSGYGLLLRARLLGGEDVINHCWPDPCSQMASFGFDASVENLPSQNVTLWG
jgi:hypothetical protein